MSRKAHNSHTPLLDTPHLRAFLLYTFLRNTFLRYVLLGCLFLAVGSRAARALDLDKSVSQCRMDAWTTRDGLPPRDIEGMAQTPDGYLWLATRAGLVRFDGVAFHVYNASNTPGFTRAMIRALAVDQNGLLWVGTDGDGFGTFQNGSYTRCRVGNAAPKWSETRAILPAADGSLWFGGQGDYCLVRKQGNDVRDVGGKIQDVRAFAQGADGSLWIASHAAGLLRARSDGTFQECNQGLPSKALTALCFDTQGGLWIGTEHQGAYRLWNGKLTSCKPVASDEIHSLCADQSGSVWMGTSRGLRRWRAGKIEAFQKRDSLFDDNVGAILEDREKNLWVGTGPALSRFNNTKLTPFAPPALPGAHIHSLYQSPDGVCWVGTSEGLLRLDGDRATTYTTRNGLPSNNVLDVCADEKGTLWTLTEGGALGILQNGRYPKWIARSDMGQMARDARGLVFKDWHSLWRLQGKTFVRLACKQDIGFIFGFAADASGSVWAGSETGLAHVVGDHVETFHDGLPPNTHVLALACRGGGELWLGTDKGLAHFQNGHFTLFGRHQGLPDDNLYQIVIDDAETLWIGGNGGIFSVKIQDVKTFARGGLPTIPSRLYEAADGIRQFPLLFGALKTRDGRLWFKGEYGLTLVNPRRMQSNALVPPVVIEQAVFNGMIMPNPHEARIAPGKGDVEIRYSGLSLAAPEKVRFRYCLEGFDKGWVDAETRRVAFYTNLPPATYRFRVMACNNDGVWNSRTPPLVFTIEPRATQTWWFRAGTAALALLVVLVLVGWRLHRLRHANRALERRIAQRTRELACSNQELQASKEAVEAANVRLQSLATTDGMTQLANHRAFQDRLRAAISDRELTGQPLAMLLADVDHFKRYNDTYGHPAGDEALRIMGRLLRDNVRPGDCVARYGGEEFAVLLPNADAQTALAIAERIRAAAEGYAFPCRRVTLSIGMAHSHDEALCPEAFVRRADQALYAAKHGGRNRVELAGPEPCPPCEQRTNQEQIHQEPLGFAEAGGAAAAFTPSASAASFDTDSACLETSEALNSLQATGSKQTLTGLLALLNLRDPETDGHSQRVARYALRLAQEVIRQNVAPLSPDDLRDLTLGALLHDIGKIGVPDAILHKPGALTETEWEVMRRHPQQGADILSAFSPLVNALPVVRSHHERWDGTGYPDGLAGKNIPLAARLFALADTLDAMSSDRPYRAALSQETIQDEIARMAGVQFDPALVRVFLAISGEEWERLKEAEAMQVEFQPTEAAHLPKAA